VKGLNPLTLKPIVGGGGIVADGGVGYDLASNVTTKMNGAEGVLEMGIYNQNSNTTTNVNDNYRHQ
jgi:hypothetical protein